ncbi:MAG: hypothetical protein GY940_34855 [bacterium]|nr:hypothetical protein [bacterium]
MNENNNNPAGAITENNTTGTNTSPGMKARDLIPVKKEFSFLFKVAAVMIASAAAALAIMYIFLDKDVGASYGSAFRLLAETGEKLNLYIVAAVLIQLVFSFIVIYFISLYFSHKIAGPVFRLKAVLQQYIDGQEIESVNFRKTDFIPGVSRLFTGFFSFLAKREKLLEEAEALVQRLGGETGKEKQALVDKLKSIVKQLEH